MAIFIPSIEKIKKFKVSPTDGELSLLTFIERTLDDSFEVYFNPYLNGDRPDILIMRKGYGVMVIGETGACWDSMGVIKQCQDLHFRAGRQD